MYNIKDTNIQLSLAIGGAVDTKKSEYIMFPPEIIKSGHIPEIVNASELLFHSDWNWLMEVVNFICNQQNIGGIQTFGMVADDGRIMFRFKNCQLHYGDTLTQACYMACLEEINWIENEDKNEKTSENK